jgi:hypothetical protein
MNKWAWMVVGMILVNLLVLDVWVFGGFGKKEAVLGDRVEKVIEKEMVEVEGCDKSCVAEIVDEKLEDLISKYGLTVKKEVKTVAKTWSAPVVKSTSEKFVRISGGSDQGSGWLRLGGTVFWLNTDLHGELVSSSWQGWLESSGGDLDGWVRLYDASNGRVVDGSEVQVTGSGKTSFYSSDISLWRGQNQYYIEVKDSGGGDMLTISEPRLRLIVR